MELPLANASGGKTRRQSLTLGGLDRARGAGEGKLTDSVGLSWAESPCLGQRRGRTLVRKITGCTAMMAWDHLFTVEGTRLCRDGITVGQVTAGKKQMAVLGNRLYIFPDKKYLELDTLELKSMETRITNQALAVFTDNTLTLTPDLELMPVTSRTYNRQYSAAYTGYGVEHFVHLFKVYDSVSYNSLQEVWDTQGEQELELWSQSTAEAELAVGKYVIFREPSEVDGELWAVNYRHRHTVAGASEDMESYGSHNRLGHYGKIIAIQLEPDTANSGGGAVCWHVRLTIEPHDATRVNPRLEGAFFPGDRVFLSGCDDSANNTPADDPLVVEAVAGDTVTFRVPQGGERVLVPQTDVSPLVIERRVPRLDLVCAWDNRLFGVDNASRTLWASALGDPGNFYTHDGGAGDSYTALAEGEGDFTGCTPYGESLLFWKEDCLCRLVGSAPASYELRTSRVPGLQRGSEGSVRIIDGVLYYKSRDGVYAYSGSTPRRVSGALGDVAYQNAAAGSDGRGYYISMERQDTGVWELLAYDTRTGLWMKEEERRCDGFAQVGGTLYLLSQSRLYTVDGGEDDDGTAISWQADFVPFVQPALRAKRPFRLLVELEVDASAWAEVLTARDGGPFHSAWTVKPGQSGVFTVPLRPGWCHSWQLRLRGEGRCLIRGLAWEAALGR